MGSGVLFSLQQKNGGAFAQHGSSTTFGKRSAGFLVSNPKGLPGAQVSRRKRGFCTPGDCRVQESVSDHKRRLPHRVGA